MPPLENYYTGDEKWNDFSGFYSESYLDDTARILARELEGHLDIAVVIYGLLGPKESFDWIYKKIPVLDNISPKDCLKSELLLKRLKTALMRMPC
ncbi:hypothetical protein QDZ16_005065 [Pluralibacter gergoviae]|mgnify:CR=1 FL=1|uniref:hypothetical protein n=1 Tax=Pluralibacter gergoviae TaxID=61647 RepID=UPI0006523861|nr:hypothetical protein [Pluralibacter gergoviae]EKV0933102.1 hypothetical protein [Pluralibacter gergoviae]EKV6250018.1 hypothetical protein [Pluralibacter gergoviae]EKW9969508.1 hypothetical protein [Pluralibacter gergoviae]ELD4274418.1 hypothetical protein [Pluralibacter gergoviae]ELD4280028.1 hypothetical protein [Pluralibacter gergoviae]